MYKMLLEKNCAMDITQNLKLLTGSVAVKMKSFYHMLTVRYLLIEAYYHRLQLLKIEKTRNSTRL